MAVQPTAGQGQQIDLSRPISSWPNRVGSPPARFPSRPRGSRRRRVAHESRLRSAGRPAALPPGRSRLARGAARRTDRRSRSPQGAGEGGADRILPPLARAARRAPPAPRRRPRTRRRRRKQRSRSVAVPGDPAGAVAGRVSQAGAGQVARPERSRAFETRSRLSHGAGGQRAGRRRSGGGLFRRERRHVRGRDDRLSLSTQGRPGAAGPRALPAKTRTATAVTKELDLCRQDRLAHRRRLLERGRLCRGRARHLVLERHQRRPPGRRSREGVTPASAIAISKGASTI